MKTTFTTITVARGLTVFVMPAVHTVMMYSKPEVYVTWWAFVLRFFAEGPGAQLFMFIMGFFLATGKPKGTRIIIIRSITLIIAGYLLNFLRLYLPARLGFLPEELLTHYGAGLGPTPYLPLLLTGDILQFAGIAYGIVGWIARSTNRLYYAALIYILFASGGPLLWGLRSTYSIADHVLALVCANDNRAFFPLFPWLCYPVAGLITGVAFVRSTDKQYFFKQLVIAGIGMMITGIGILSITPSGWEADFYRSSPGKAIAYTGFTAVWLYLVNKWMQYSSIHHPVVRLLTFCGRHITVIYFLHWIIICWCIPLIGYHQLDQRSTLLAISIISVTSFGFTFLFRKIKSFAQASKA